MKKKKNSPNKIKHVVSTYIDYDKTIPVSAVSENVLSFLPLEKLLADFRIVTDFKQKWLEDLNLDAKLTYLFKRGRQKYVSVDKILKSEYFNDYVNNSAKPEQEIPLIQTPQPSISRQPTLLHHELTDNSSSV